MKELVVITGASSGFGKEMAKVFSEKGHPLLLLGRRTEKMLELNLPHTIVQKSDVRELSSYKEAILAAEKVYGKVGLLVNNAGQMLLGDVRSQAQAEWQTMIDTNIIGVLNGMQSVLPDMRKRRSGTIINVSSIAGFKAFGDHAAYCASKFGVHGMTETVRMESAMDNVRVMLISPGAAETELLSHTTDTAIKTSYNSWKETMGGVAMDPRKVAESVAYMYSMPQEVTIRELVIAPTKQDN